MSEEMKQVGRFGRDGVAVEFDVINDRLENSNLVLVGPCGTGKTVNLVEKVMDCVERHNARVVVIEPGAAFDLVVTALEEQGKTIHRHVFNNVEAKKLTDALVEPGVNIELAVEKVTKELSDQMRCSNGGLQDVLHFNVGQLMRDYREREKRIAFAAVLNGVANCLSQEKNQVRPTVIVCDEFQCFLYGTGSEDILPMLSESLKALNEQNAWLWISSQNVADIPSAAAELMKSFEWWEILPLHEHDIDHLKMFRDLSQDEVFQLKSLEVRRRQFVEGLVLSRPDVIASRIFRFVPKSVSLAFSMTDPDEKMYRSELAKSLAISELDAVYEIAKSLDDRRGIGC